MNKNSQGKYKLKDLIDIKYFQNLQDRLYEAYSFPSSIVDIEGNILTATAWQDICSRFHRQNEECEKACIQSDKYIFEHLDEANPAVTYKCPHGLVDNATPIIVDGVHYGNFFTGQFFLEEPDMDFFRKQAGRYGFPEEEYIKSVEKVPVWTKEQLDSYLFFIKGLIAVISETVIKNLREIENKKNIEKSEDRYRSILEIAMDGFWVIDMKGCIIEVNNTYCKMSGYSRQELLKMSIPDIEADESQEEIGKSIQRVMAKGGDRFIRNHKRKDGSHFTVEVSVKYLPEENGFFCFLRDLTEKRNSEAALKESEGRYEAIIQATIDGFWMTDVECNLLQVNDAYCKMSGYSEDELLAMTVFDLEVNDPKEIHDRTELMRNQGYAHFETKHRRKDGSTFDVEVILQSHPDNRDTFFSFTRDITERKQLELQLQQAQKMESIGTLAGGIAHDFNNILSPIMLNTEMLMDEISSNDPIHHCMKDIYHASERARDLVRQILTIAQKRPVQKVVLKASCVIADAIKFIRSTVPTTIDIRFDNRAKHDTVLADPTQLSQIVLNLCTNAAHAMSEKGGLLELVLENKEISAVNKRKFTNLKPGMYLELSARDNGTGISPGIIDRIFEPYYTTKQTGEGSGLGLSIIHGIARDCGGDLTVESKIGKGTVFYVYLPLTDLKPSVEGEQKQGVLTGTERILLVDDEKVLIDTMQKGLERLGYKVIAKTGSKEALEVFRQNPDGYDIVITDMTMPGMTGKELSKAMKEIRKEVPIILCTGYSDKIDDKSAKSLGINAFVMKPIVMKDIAQTIRELLDSNP